MLRIVYDRLAEEKKAGMKIAHSRKKKAAGGKAAIGKKLWERLKRWFLMEPEPEPEEPEDRYTRARKLHLREKTWREMQEILEADYPTDEAFAKAVLQYAEQNPEGFALLYPSKRRSPFTFSVE